jgi:hypothetical protein
MLNPATVSQGMQIVGTLSGLLNGVDTMKPQGACGLTMNTEQGKRLANLDLPPLTTQWRTSVKRPVNGKATMGRTWQECVKARTAYSSQITGPMGNPDMMDFMPNVADEMGMLKLTIQAEQSPYVNTDPATFQAAAGGQAVKTVATGTTEQSQAMPSQLPAWVMPLAIGGAVLLGLMLIKG